jgi:hypothetical protein
VVVGGAEVAVAEPAPTTAVNRYMMLWRSYTQYHKNGWCEILSLKLKACLTFADTLTEIVCSGQENQ